MTEEQAAPPTCTSCGHRWIDHDVPDSYEGETPNPLVCPVDGCSCRDVTPTPDDLLRRREGDQS